MTDVAVLGAGAIGLGMSAFLAARGHRVRQFVRGLPPAPVDYPIEAEGAVKWRGSVPAAGSIEAVIADVEAIFVCVPGNAQQAMLDAAAAYLRPGQVVVISSQYSLSALYLSRRLVERGTDDVPIVALATTMVTGRRLGPHAVRVRKVRDRYPYAAYDEGAGERVSRLLQDLSGKRLERVSMADITFSNANPLTHVPNAIFNFTRIELREDWSNWRMITPAVIALIERLDSERCAAARTYGATPVSFAAHLHNSFGVPLGPIGEMCAQIAGTFGELNGPTDLSTRYLTEDVPFGLLPIAVLSDLSGIEATMHKALIALASAACSRSFETENDLLPALGLEALPRSVLMHRILGGWAGDAAPANTANHR